MKKYIFRIIEIILVIIIIIYSVLIIKWFINTKKSRNLVNEINTSINVEDIRNGKNEIDFDYLIKINPETVGYLIVEDADINYPVVRTSNNDYYLNHSFDGSKNTSGWVFMDYRNIGINDKNTIIYGHNMRDGSMFGKLKTIKNKKEAYITYYDNNTKYRYKVFSVYEINSEDYYIKTTFADNEYISFLNTLTKRSINNYNYEPKEEDNIITLSTCSKLGKRFVVHAYRR